jgi:hypothetical protein
VVAITVAERRFLATDQAVDPKLFSTEAVVGLAVVAGVGDQLVVSHDVGCLGGERDEITEVATGSWPDPLCQEHLRLDP